MPSLLSVLASTVAPVLVVAGIGYVLGRYMEVDVEALNTVTLYVLTPALVFESLATTAITSRTAFQLVAGFSVFTLAMLVVAEGVGRLLDVGGARHDALVVTSAFPNTGNFGIPVAAFAFGALGRSTAVLVMITQTVLTYTLAAYVTTRSTGESLRDAVEGILRIPVLYAVVAALVVRWFDAVPPTDGEVMRTVSLLGDAAIPMFLLILGLQLAATQSGTSLAETAPALGLKSVVAPVVGFGSLLLVGIDDPAVAGAFLVECAAPAAVTPLLFLIEFGERPAGVGPDYASTVILGTLATSLPAVGLIIVAVQTGVLP